MSLTPPAITPTPTPTTTPTTPTSSAPGGSPVLAQVVNGAEEHASSPVTAPPLTTTAAGDLILAFVSADGPSGQVQKVKSVTGGGLTWTLASRANMVKGTGTAEVWQAYATSPLKAVTIKATLEDKNWDGAITVAAFTGAASAVGATASAGARKGAPAVTVTTTAPGSLVLAAGHNWSNDTTETPVAGQRVLAQVLDTRVKDTYWAQQTAPVAVPGKVTVADTAPLDGRWELAAVEVLPAGATPTPTPTVTTTATATATPTPTTGGAPVAVTYGYDKQGDRISVTPAGGSATTLSYDQANRLTGFGAPGTTASYAYNGDGLRMSKTVNGATTAFTWDLAEPEPQLLYDGTTAYIYGPGDQPIEQIASGTPTYLLDDQQGSTRLLTDASGNVAGTYTYTPYGAVTGHTGSAATPLEYDGQYTDAETGYLYLRDRYYDPSTGQFLTRDPLAAVTGSAYQYAAGNPLNVTDPSGLCPKKDCPELLNLINEQTEKIAGKANDMINNTKLPLYGPQGTVQSHINPFLGYQTYLRNLIGQFIEGDCGDVPEEALEQATRPIPVDIPPLPQPGQNNSTAYSGDANNNTAPGINWGHVAEVGGTIIVIGGIIYFTGGLGALALGGEGAAGGAGLGGLLAAF